MSVKRYWPKDLGSLQFPVVAAADYDKLIKVIQDIADAPASIDEAHTDWRLSTIERCRLAMAQASEGGEHG